MKTKAQAKQGISDTYKVKFIIFFFFYSKNHKSKLQFYSADIVEKDLILC